MTEPTTVPSFARVEIRVKTRGDILAAVAELRTLAERFHDIGLNQGDDAAATILAHHAIRATSQKLRGR